MSKKKEQQRFYFRMHLRIQILQQNGYNKGFLVSSRKQKYYNVVIYF